MHEVRVLRDPEFEGPVLLLEAEQADAAGGGDGQHSADVEERMSADRVPMSAGDRDTGLLE